MRNVDIITKKKKGLELSKEELREIVNAPDYQVSAFLMAVCFMGMTDRETVSLTELIRDSGETLDFSGIDGIKVDKHSTGGVGDKITLIVLPWVASLGLKVIKMSGKGLGFTGGTIDKLNSIKGFRTDLSPEEVKNQVENIGLCLISQSGNLTPLDKKLYALRDITATVDSLPLVASSVMGKKLAFGADKIVLDIKCGSGAFMKNFKDAENLARIMCNIGNALGKETDAIITRMEEPLGRAIGNSLELEEAIMFLKNAGEKPRDLYEISIKIASRMLILGGIFNNEETAKKALEENLNNGLALKKFEEFIATQGGDLREIPEAREKIPVISDIEGYVSGIDAEKIGLSSMMLGAGRTDLNSPLDYSAGIILNKRYGDYVKAGDTLATIHTDIPYGEAINLIKQAYRFMDTPPETVKYVLN